MLPKISPAMHALIATYALKLHDEPANRDAIVARFKSQLRTIAPSATAFDAAAKIFAERTKT